ncbi:metallophosphoesterase [Pelosinus sp. IPA-1]|uniref:metallophosphoesterase n=1 Tax=Pelosinus sp. IPA-1 TaxID=3029569 RepID=UPI0024361C8F|nr:metallophosphoesterase [Pelosinus sp. IPA-1]GMA99149.1 serine/threonine protein phosphatase [Pelosinus sp. IPA-1]
MRTVDRILATSDVHGENKKLLSLLEKAAYEPDKDLLVVCGDLVDRGEENLATLTTCIDLQKKGAIILKGNHEKFLEECLKEMIINDTISSENVNLWVGHNGGASTYDEIRNLSQNELINILKFVRSLPTYFTSGTYIFSHAGADTRKPVEKNSEDDLIWMEDRFPYCSAYKNKIMVFGHVPTWLLYSYDKKFKKKNAKIWYDKTWNDKIGIDCGGVFGGNLAAIELPTYREFYE